MADSTEPSDLDAARECAERGLDGAAQAFALISIAESLEQLVIATKTAAQVALVDEDGDVYRVWS